MSEDLDLSRMIAYCAHLGMLYRRFRRLSKGPPLMSIPLYTICSCGWPIFCSAIRAGLIIWYL